MSETGDRGAWVDITTNSSGFPTNWSRTEFTVCVADPNTLYAVGSVGGGGSSIYKTTDRCIVIGLIIDNRFSIKEEMG